MGKFKVACTYSYIFLQYDKISHGSRIFFYEIFSGMNLNPPGFEPSTEDRENRNIDQPELSNNINQEREEAPRKPMGRGRGYPKTKAEQSQAKTHYRKAMAAKKNNFNAPGFF